MGVHVDNRWPLVLILGLVALICCPAADILEMIRAFGAWLHGSVHVG
jgi:hypothetical protein